MGKMLTSVMIWLVAIAVPAQGIAAATMMHCGVGSHHAQAASNKVEALPHAHLVAPVDHAAHQHASHPDPDADTASEPVQSTTSSDASGTARPDKGVGDVKAVKTAAQKCSVCASCCAGLALPSTAVILPSLDPAHEVTVLPPREAASVVVDGPERPPRVLRA